MMIHYTGNDLEPQETRSKVKLRLRNKLITTMPLITFQVINVRLEKFLFD